MHKPQSSVFVLFLHGELPAIVFTQDSKAERGPYVLGYPYKGNSRFISPSNRTADGGFRLKYRFTNATRGGGDLKCASYRGKKLYNLRLFVINNPILRIVFLYQSGHIS